MQRWYIVMAMFCALAASGRAQVYWQSDFGPWGGRVNDLFEDAAGDLYAATMQGVYRSTDEGLSWHVTANDGTPVYGVHRTRTGMLLISTAEVIWRSPDAGMSWALAAYHQGVTHGPFFEHSSGMLFCEPWHHSMDDGRTWSVLVEPPIPLIPSAGEIGMWSEAPTGEILAAHASMTLPDFEWTRYSPTVVEGQQGFVHYRFNAGNGILIGWTSRDGLVRSLDGGATWTMLGVPNDSIRHDVAPEALSVSRSGGCLIRLTRGVHVTPTSGVHVYSFDYGVSWEEIPEVPFDPGYGEDVLCTSRGALFTCGGTPGIFRYDTARGSWSRLVHGVSRTSVNRVLPLGDGGVLAMTAELRELQESSDLVAWEIRHGFETEITDLCRLRSGGLLAATRGEGVRRSTDEGRSWAAAGIGDRLVNTLRQLRDSRVLAGTGDGLSVSSDDGEHWIEVRSIPLASIECLLERANGEIVLGGEDGVSIGNSFLNTWRSVRFSWMPVMRLAETPDGVLFAGTLDDGLYRSSDDGATWTQVGFDGEWITGIVAPDPSYCFVATRRSGIYESRDGGEHWSSYFEGLHSLEILDLAAGPDGHLYAGTVRGIGRSAYPVLTAQYLTPDFTLEQNTPNPATDHALFGWSIPRAGQARMSLYDVLGRELAVLFDGRAEPGLHWQSVDTRTLVPGTYFCVLRFEGQLRDRKFQVAR